MADVSHPERHSPSRQLPLNLPASVFPAACLAIGIWLSSYLPIRPILFLTMTLVWLLTSAALIARRIRGTATVSLLILITLLGVCRWQMTLPVPGRPKLTDFCHNPNTFVSLRATVITVPVVHENPDTDFSVPQDSKPQTRFQAAVSFVITDVEEERVTGNCQVYVTGDATSDVSAGDELLLTGRLDWPRTPGNPGGFDVPRYLTRQRISGMLFVISPQAIRVIQPVHRANPRRWISFLRRDARSVIVNYVHPYVQGVALALLLGNRHQLPSEIQESFISSGTMHLLAISGLHVGILCLFLLRIMNLLLITRRRALLIAAVICVAYAMVTDLRPSVVRATVFFGVFVVSQLCGRHIRVSSLLSITIIMMLLAQPELLFDTGAWLSFLSVAALGCVSRSVTPDRFDREAPADAITMAEQFRMVAAEIRHWLWLRFRQVLVVVAVTAPLVATTFHMVSPVGLVVNVLLIPVMVVTLWAGFITLLVGMLLPAAAFIPGTAFSWLLAGLMTAVDWSATIPAGHLYIPDLPDWFVPLYYSFLATALVLRQPAAKSAATVALLLSVVVAFLLSSVPQTANGLRITVLDVGHGSAAVVEVDDQVLLVDAGALNRGERTADLICGFLWHSGYRKLNGIVLSHADMDHYDAVPGILARFPVAEIITSREFLKSEAPSVQAVIALAGQNRIPVRLAADGDSCFVSGADIQILQADTSQLAPEAEDNETSLVVRISYADRHVILPGDIEGTGLEQLLPRMGTADVLVSPHHGSTNSNTPAVAVAVRPHAVAVSARSASGRDFLENVFADSETVYFTSEDGAVSVIISPEGRLRLTGFRRPDR